MKHIVITGGAGGIGRHLVKHLIKHGYSISIIGRSEENYKRLISFLGLRDNIQFFQVDVSNYVEVQEIFSILNKSKINLFALINMASTQSPIGEFIECNIDEWSKNLSINLLGVVNMVYEFAKTSNKTDEKRKIINFSGGGATSSRPNFSGYGVSKTGVVKFTEILADEFENENIDINSVSPGAINTNMTDEIINAGEKAGLEYSIALNRKDKGGDNVEKIVELCLFLLSSESNGISGKLISATWDDFNSGEFLERLRNDSNFCTLRRIDSTNFDNRN